VIFFYFFLMRNAYSLENESTSGRSVNDEARVIESLAGPDPIKKVINPRLDKTDLASWVYERPPSAHARRV
jgi:hypothetical protein